MKKIVIIILAGIILPVLVLAQENTEQEVIEAVITRVLEEKTITRDNGSEYIQQNLQLKGLEGEWKDQELTFTGISDLDVVSANVYGEGDKVLVNVTEDMEGNQVFYVFDYIRRGQLYWLAIIFALVIVLIGGWKGLRSLISLLLTFLVILKFIVPQILNGANPVLIGAVGSFIILVLIIYITEGWNRKSHLAVSSILLSIFITGLLSALFTAWTKLTGTAQEEVLYLVGLGKATIDFRGLLLAAIIIGTLGVLDDVVISQIETACQIKSVNPNLGTKAIFRKTFQVGKSHMGSMVNTLFLAYAGASLPLLLLFSINQPPFATFSQVINSEIIATEIVRTLVGSIGLALAIPIATYLAAKYINKGKNAQTPTMPQG